MSAQSLSLIWCSFSLSLSLPFFLFSLTPYCSFCSLCCSFIEQDIAAREKKMTLSQLSFMSSLECLSFWQQRGDSSLYSRAVCRAAYSKVTLIEPSHHLPAFLCLFPPVGQYNVPVFLVKLSCYLLKSVLYVNVSYRVP